LGGQVLFHGALLRSGLVPIEDSARELQPMLAAAGKRSFLLTTGYSFAADLVDRAEKAADVEEYVWPTVKDSMTKEDGQGGELSLDKLWLLLALNQKSAKVPEKTFTRDHFNRKVFVAEALCEDAAGLFFNTSLPLRAIKTHPVVPTLMTSFGEANLLAKFFKGHVNPRLADTSTSYRTVIAFVLLDAALARLAGMGENAMATASDLVTANLVRAALNHLAKVETDSEDDKVILSAFSKLSSAAKDCADIQIPLLNRLLVAPAGNIAFDKLSGSNVVHQLLANCNVKAVKHAGKLHKDVVLGHSEKDQAEPTNPERAYAAHQLAKLVCHSCLQRENAWRAETLSFLMATTLFRVEEKMAPLKNVPAPFNRETRKILGNAFYKALDFKASLEDRCVILAQVLDTANNLLSKAQPHQAFDEVAMEAWKKLTKTVVKIEQKGASKEDLVFKLLFSQMGCFLLTEPSVAAEALEDLFECYERSKVRKSKRRKSAAKASDEPEWIEVIVDLLLSLLAQNKHHLSQLAKSVFALLSDHVTDDAVAAVLDAVHPPIEEEEAAEENGKTDSDDDDDDDSDGDDDNDDNDKDEEDEDDDDQEDEETGDEGDDDEGEVTEDIREKIKRALGEHAEDEGDDDGEDNEDAQSIDMDDIDEEDMNKMDEALANVFRQLSGKKSGKEKRKEKMDALAKEHFRMRAIDLLDAYFAHEPSVAHILAAIPRLVAAIESAVLSKGQESLRERLKASLRRVTSVKKPVQIKASAASPEAFADVLSSLTDMANRAAPVMTTLANPQPLFAQICSLVLKLGLAAEDDAMEASLRDIYVKAAEDFSNTK